MRRAISIETDLLRIQGEIRATAEMTLRRYAILGDELGNRLHEEEQADAQDDRCEDLDRAVTTPRALTYCFLRLGNLDNGAFGHLDLMP
jgi:hypothetical protein